MLCGEASGDAYAGRLISALYRLDPSLEIYAMGGKECYRAGAKVIADPTGLAVVGIWEVLQHYDEFHYLYRTVKEHILETRPSALVFVDYPGFNLRLARELRPKLKNTKFVYYISPQLWAWGRGRVKYMRMMDEILVIFPFEVEFYARYGIKARFVGHPLGEVLRDRRVDRGFRRRLGLGQEEVYLALLPGSRRQELERHLPVMLEALSRWGRGVKAGIHRAPTLERFMYSPFVESSGAVLIEPEDHGSSLAGADLVWVASGTATVETMYYRKPMVVVYKVSPMTYYLLRWAVRVKHISMVNILYGGTLVPELIQKGFTPEDLLKVSKEILKDRERYEFVSRELGRLSDSLFSGQASQTAARVILEGI